MTPAPASVIDDAVVLTMLVARLQHATLGLGAGVRVLLPSEPQRVDEGPDAPPVVQIVSLSIDDEPRINASRVEQDAGAALVCTLNLLAPAALTQRDASAVEKLIARVRRCLGRALLSDAPSGHLVHIDRVVAASDPPDDPSDLRTAAVRAEGHARRAEPSHTPNSGALRPAPWEI